MQSDNLTSAENVPSWTFTHTVTHCPHGLPLPYLCADSLRAPGTDGADYHLGYLDGFAEALEGSLDGASPAWLGALLLLAALLLGAGIGWLVRG